MSEYLVNLNFNELYDLIKSIENSILSEEKYIENIKSIISYKEKNGEPLKQIEAGKKIIENSNDKIIRLNNLKTKLNKD